MKKVFQVKDLIFYEEDFLEDIKDFEDIIEIIQELSPSLSYEMIEVAGDNGCCDKTKKNLLVEIIGYIDENDEFITKEERDAMGILADGMNFDLFVITIHKCTACGKWVISLLEE
ncbi:MULTISPECIES: hypothetical protein [Clostridium]|uniref:hypothetical protein n=1 Tax=Clostridium TaxID=1485 RepID=UPI0002CACF77|nr:MULTISPECIES: hypothetical protein [Clostridium]APF23899.1 hypothetical protein NPD4_2385 [Clostridium butyricum]EMU55089.1 hypothetical protein CBDKU1_10970 [Clostridium butyricum DKU-01]MBS4840126.1 hypothetical protein [Clostridium sp.]MDB2157176.1 hypothetical protein [Clostridium butyricum]MDU1401116.1 hypothetical protein [Clostridium sp.]